ncbi:MAG: BlaI/MecI/CopY family transcriptional regulator [Bacteroidetes bacterium]|jgi:predicted transcriptional regulator|nr:BlaI/MecI/CopY family transcriptional regulator [Bacteroidota bacterium]
MAKKHPHHELSRRERQIMDIIYRRGEATAAEVMEDLPDAPSYSAVRALLRILVEKGHAEYRQEGPRYVYRSTTPVDKAQESALNHVVHTFFEGSVPQAVAALLDLSDDQLTQDDLNRLNRLIRDAKDEGR